MTAAGVTLREATAMDAGQIADVHVEAWQATYPGLLPDRYLASLSPASQAERWREAIARGRRGEVLVATAEGPGVVGFVNWGETRGRKAPQPAEIYAIYVAPDWQDQGIGRDLLKAAFEEMAAAGHGGALLWVLASNPARFFYEAMGGTAVGSRRERFAGTELEETAYAWPDLFTWLSAWR